MGTEDASGPSTAVTSQGPPGPPAGVGAVAGDAEAVGRIDGCFALVGRDGVKVRLARSLSVPMRTFIVKRQAGPALLVAHRIDELRRYLTTDALS